LRTLRHDGPAAVAAVAVVAVSWTSVLTYQLPHRTPKSSAALGETLLDPRYFSASA
jgi:hypothetical protein